MYTLEAEDQYPSNLAEQDIDKVLSKGRSDNGGLDAEIQVKKKRLSDGNRKRRYKC